MEATLDVTNSVSKGSGSFVIDHPLDPANKLLYHSFVESPDVKNIYDGIVTLDSSGEAVVHLPDYFETLNKDYRYQIKGLDISAPNLYVKQEIGESPFSFTDGASTEENKFTIAGGPPGGQVSWQVTGIRQDPYIIANPIIPEVEKGPGKLVDKGEYLFEGYNSVEENTKENVSMIWMFIRSVGKWLTSLFD